MPADRLEKLSELFEAARALPAGERREYLRGACGDDPALGEEVLSLVEAAEGADESLDELAERLVARAAHELIDNADGEAAEGLVGGRVGRYEVRELLGRGGMGFVFRAFDPALGRDVALKFLPPGLSGESAERRLRDEARAVSGLDHRNIAVVHEIGEAESEAGPPWAGRLYIALGYYAGETLAQKITRGPLSVRESLDLAQQVAAGLDRAHEAGIVHCDVTPSNILVTSRGIAKLIDFGVAQVVGAPASADGAPGTLAYMSPEQTRGERIDRRTDLWSLGVVLHEMLAGERPFRSETVPGLLRAIQHDEPPNLSVPCPELPSAVVELVSRCLEKSPSDRYRDAGLLRAELREAAAGLGRGADPGAEARAPTSGVRPRRMWATAGGAVATLLILTTVAVTGLLRREDPDADAFPTMPGIGIDPTGIAVLPMTPSSPDSALDRLGRDLVITLSATLDGIAGIATADPRVVLARVGGSRENARRGALTRARAQSFAGELGVGRVLVGGLAREGSDARIDAELLDAAEDDPVARVTVTGPVADVGALTDSLTLSLVRELWAEAPPVALSLAAVTTRSVPALRAYLEGERALAGRDMQGAVESFDRAFEADTTFLFAYWRSLYPRAYHESSEPPDSATMARILEHAREFPVRERLLFEAWNEASLGARLRQLRALVDRFGSYGPGWYSYANALVHFGPFVGTTADDARIAIQRAAALTPDFAPAWNHVLWIALSQRDTESARTALGELERSMDPTDYGAIWLRVERLRYDMMLGLPAPDSLARVVDWTLSIPPGLVTRMATGFVADYGPTRQLAFNEELLERTPGAEIVAAAWLGNALSWLARGSWDAALGAADRYGHLATDDGVGPRRAYGLAVAGAVLGVLPPEEALRRRPTDPLATEYSQTAAAELTWLDGMLAHAQKDGRGIGRAMNRLRTSPSADAQVLRESLEAFAADAAGDRERAIRLLVDRERRTGDEWTFLRLRFTAPLLVVIDRMVAAKWLIALERDEEAASLLTFHDAIGLPVEEAWRRSLGITALLDRARIAEAAGRLHEARWLYALFVEVFDRPDPDLKGLRREALDGFARLAQPPPDSS